MWHLYAREKDGIAIRTTFAQFSRSFISKDDIFIGKVKYADYHADFVPEGNMMSPFLYKRKSFEHEREVRAMTQKLPAHDGKVDLSQDIYQVGRYYEVDLSALVQTVVIAPFAEPWFLELVQSLATRYGLKAPVNLSELGESPSWGYPTHSH